MNQEEKLKKYDELVKKVNNCPNIGICNQGIKISKSGEKNHEQSQCRSLIKTILCENCGEVNLWTYWEGGRDRLDAEILVVGQDWGQIPDPKATADILKQTGDARFGTGYRNIFEDMESVTDENLCRLFKEVKGCEKIKCDYYNAGRMCKNVFFTNYVCCYREGKTSGGFNSVWTENCKEHFTKLVDIIQPKVIICLGRKVFDSVLVAAGKPRSKGSYNDTILKGAVSVSFGDATTMVFPMAHPGAMGTLNRCKAKDNVSKESGKTIGLELKKSDWKKINQYI